MNQPESLVCWNVGPRRAPQILWSLNRLRRAERPDAIALFEAHRALRLIRRVYSRNWRIYVTDDVVLLVRKRLEQPKVHPFGHQVEWWGPHGGIEHQGREHMAAEWASGELWALMHGVPGGPRGGVNEHLRVDGQHFGKNRPAWAADDRVLAKVLREHKGPKLVAGDLNAERAELAARWDALDLRAIPTRAHVDHAAESVEDDERWKATRLDNYRSDHPAIRYDRVAA